MNNEQLALTTDKIESLESYLNLGNSFSQQQQWSEAIANYQQALKLSPESISSETYRKLAFACKKNGDIQLAFSYLFEAYQQEPTIIDAQEHYLLGEKLRSYGKPGKAADCYRQAIALNPDAIEAYFQLGKLLTLEGYLDKAINIYRRAIQNHPDRVEFYYLLAEANLSQANCQEAVFCYRKAIELDPNADRAYFGLAEICRHRKNWTEAVSNYKKTLKINSNHYQACLQLGIIWQQQQQWEKAAAAYRQSILLNPNAIESYLNFASLLTKQSKYEAAFHNYRQVIQMSPNASINETQAIAGYRQALITNPNTTAKDRYQLAKLLRGKSHFAEAIEEYKKAIELDPNCYLAYIDIQYTPIESQQLHELIDFYRQLLQKHPHLAIAWGNLGDAFTQQGNLSEAIDCYQKSCFQIAIAANPKLAELDWKATKENPPDFIIIGASKCGTSSLHQYLGCHPQILLPHKKEIDFFWKNYDKGIDWYLAHFPTITDRADFLTGEATPNYIRFPEVAERIYRLSPQTKLILLLRNPIDRAVSWHYHKINTGLTKVKIEEAIALEIKQIEHFSENKIIKTAFYNPDNILSSLYIYKIREWLKYFAKEQLLILKSEDLYEKPAEIVKQVFDFLELPEYQLTKYPKVNVGSYSPISEELRNTLANYFQPYNQQLEEYLGRKFDWI
ncbi:MAG: tetratricopeptide repeat protein [Xenococcaceae cyanobacterium]